MGENNLLAKSLYGVTEKASPDLADCDGDERGREGGSKRENGLNQSFLCKGANSDWG